MNLKERIISGTLVFIGLGLHDEMGLSLRAIDEIKGVDSVYAEFYTSVMAGLSLEKLERLVKRKVNVLSRKGLEEEGLILRRAKEGRVALLVPGDPLIATTHIELRIRAEKQGIKTQIIHGASIISAIIGLSGLQNYKFGRSVTIPFFDDSYKPETPYTVIFENMQRGLHTLCFLDVDIERDRYMTIGEALKLLLSLEKRLKRGVINLGTLVVGVAKAGSRHPVVKAGYLKEVITYTFGSPPHSLVFPGKLHFMEVEALINLAKAPENIRRD